MSIYFAQALHLQRQSVRLMVSGVDYSLATLRANGRGEDMRIE